MEVRSLMMEVVSLVMEVGSFLMEVEISNHIFLLFTRCCEVLNHIGNYSTKPQRL